MDDALTLGWGEFYVATAGAAAALAGLVMVAISVNIKEILALGSLPSRAGTAVASLVLVVVAAVAGLIPEQPTPALGLEILLATVVPAVLHVVSWRQILDQGVAPRVNRVLRLPVSMVQMGPFLVGAVLLLGGTEAGLSWIAAGIILTLIGSMLDAWVLMVEILR